ncbi:MAG: DNA mismatch repair protein MutS [Lachnospiraceae bacterium]|nr:DNA mismatch repair protein MutS [Lachnospiraceae bacterium]
MMRHYLNTKKEYPDCILFYRLGDFYEMFFEDAKTVSKELELTLTGKSCGLEERAPMCGVPFHAVDTYLTRLVAKGYKVAVCEQMEDPKTAKGIVKREVIKVVTPGTNTDIQSLDEGSNNYLMAVAYGTGQCGISVADVTTGDFFVTELDSEEQLMDEMARYSPKEIICNPEFQISGINMEELHYRLGVTVYTVEDAYFNADKARELLLRQFHADDLMALGLEKYDAGIRAAGAAFRYLKETQKQELKNFLKISPYKLSNSLVLDLNTRRNLELTETLREKKRKGSLLWVLDQTKTAMGARRLRSILEEPLVKKKEILKRLDAVEELNSRVIDRDELREYLGNVYDLERLLCKITYGSANPRDLIALRNSLAMLPHIVGLLGDFKSVLIRSLIGEVDGLKDIYGLIDNAILEDPPLTQKDGGIIREGYNKEVDELRAARKDGRKWLSDLEEREKERTGIKNLKIKFNKVFGYSIEVTKSFISQVPSDYVRKQTLANGERYITDELKKMEDIILNAEDRLKSLEYELFSEVRERLSANADRISKTAKAIAMIDSLQSLAFVAERNHYVRPSINEQGILKVKNARHPVVERMLERASFVPNDIELDNKEKLISIITGPNMAGKSTYMRQCALIVLMAAIGSFVPADSADICTVDRIFTRVGASDDLSSGQSTFMVEMNEVANILKNATPKSLLILDEIGRGTSTFDGLSIAWAVVEYIANKKIIGAKTLFATHYHELTELEGRIPNVHNYCFAVKENGDDVVFLRKIVAGGSDRSYGIHVASLAGVPAPVIHRADEILKELLENDLTYNFRIIAEESLNQGKPIKKTKPLDQVDLGQMTLFDTVKDDDVLRELREMDISRMTPLEALNALNGLQSKLNNRW